MYAPFHRILINSRPHNASNIGICSISDHPTYRTYCSTTYVHWYHIPLKLRNPSAQTPKISDIFIMRSSVQATVHVQVSLLSRHMPGSSSRICRCCNKRRQGFLYMTQCKDTINYIIITATIYGGGDNDVINHGSGPCIVGLPAYERL
jgi:hypothetical protein